MHLDDLLSHMAKIKASDLHISSGRTPKFRVDGEVINVPEFSNILDSKEAHSLLFEIMLEPQKKDFENTKELDFSYEIDNLARFRINCFEQQRGFGSVIRIIPNDIKSFQDLGVTNEATFIKLCSRPKGLVLVTGPTGSGKSTTLAAMIDYINTHRKEHILTIEDPIEFVHPEKKCLINQREVHRNTMSFGNALKAALREDPDIILVGEMRDLETIRLALTAAETGHLVFGTLHTTSAAKTIDRIIDVFPPEEKSMIRTMLSESLQGVISQVLLKKNGGGRVAAQEIMINTTAIKNLIRENKIAQIYSTIQTGASTGMITMEAAVLKLFDQKKLTKQVTDEFIESLKA